MPRITPPLKLTTGQREELEGLCRKKTIDARISSRARLILLAAEGRSNVEIATLVSMGRDHVRKWRQRFQASGVEALWDKDRPGRPPTHTIRQKKRVVITVCGKPPKGRSRWTISSLAAKTNLSAPFVFRVLKEHDLHPHRLRTFNFSPDPNGTNFRHEQAPRIRAFLCMFDGVDRGTEKVSGASFSCVVPTAPAALRCVWC